MSANVSDYHLSNIIACDISANKYSEHVKTATVRLIFKKDDEKKIKNYRSLSLLNIFPKIYERFLHENLTSYVNKFFFNCSNHFNSLDWKLEKVSRWEKICWWCLNELIKGFWLHASIAKVYAYGFSVNAITVHKKVTHT